MIESGLECWFKERGDIEWNSGEGRDDEVVKKKKEKKEEVKSR